jgi:hypothetical protein
MTQLVSLPAGTWRHAVNTNANIVPTVANGKVYVASNAQMQIFGLLPAQQGATRNAAPKHVTASAADVVTCPAETATAPAGEHEFHGTVCRAEGSEIRLALRDGHTLTVDVSHAFDHHRTMRLTPGRPVVVHATVDGKGAAHAKQVTPSHVVSPLTPADR